MTLTDPMNNPAESFIATSKLLDHTDRFAAETFSSGDSIRSIRCGQNYLGFFERMKAVVECERVITG